MKRNGIKSKIKSQFIVCGSKNICTFGSIYVGKINTMINLLYYILFSIYIDMYSTVYFEHYSEVVVVNVAVLFALRIGS